jgi:hypothetical protein
MRRDLLSRRWESNPLTDGSRPPVLKTLVTSRYIFADVTGVEPAPNCVTGRHLNRLTSHPYFSLSDRVRTCGLRVPNSPLYQTELHLVIFFLVYVRIKLAFLIDHIFVVGTGFEPVFREPKSRVLPSRRPDNICCPTRARTSTLSDQNRTCCQITP